MELSGAPEPGPASAITSALEPTQVHEKSRVKAKRNRLILSCQPCHRRKQQCDRGHPCSRCVKRGIIEGCVYEVPSEVLSIKRPNGSQAEKLPERVAQLESLVQATLGNIDSTSPPGVGALLQLVQAATRTPSSSTHLSMNPDNRSDITAVQTAAAALGQLSQQSAPQSSNHSGSFGGLIDYLQSADQTINLSGGLIDPRVHLPERSIISTLLAHFFDSSTVPWLWPIVYRPIIDRCFMTFASGVGPSNPGFAGLLAIICALSIQFMPDPLVHSDLLSSYPSGLHGLKKNLFDYAKSVLDDDRQPLSIERVQTLFFSSLFYENEGNISQSYCKLGMAIRAAQALNMHRKDLAINTSQPLELEVCRRLWWSLFIMDRNQCFILRKPYMIQNSHCDVLEPHSSYRPSFQSIEDFKTVDCDDAFPLHQISFAKTLGKTWDRCFSTQIPTYDDVLSQENELIEFEQAVSVDLPTSTVQGPHTAMSQFQKTTMILEAFHVHFLLMRHFFFKAIMPESDTAEPSDPKQVPIPIQLFHQYASQVSVSYCRKTLANYHYMWLESRQRLREGFRWPSMVLQIFDSALSICVAAILSPECWWTPQDRGWVLLGMELLQHLEPYNTLAANAGRALQACLVEVEKILYSRGIIQDPVGDQKLPEATILEVLSQPLLSVSKLWNEDSTVLSNCTDFKAGVFSGNFPGPEAVCGPLETDSLQRFLSSCAAQN